MTVPLPFFPLYQHSTLCPCDNNHPCGNKVAVCCGFGLRPRDQWCHPWSGERCVPMVAHSHIRSGFYSGCLEPLLGSLRSLLLLVACPFPLRSGAVLTRSFHRWCFFGQLRTRVVCDLEMLTKVRAVQSPCHILKCFPEFCTYGER